MKNIYKYLLIFTASALVVSCGESDLEPTLALDKDLDSGINSAADLSICFKQCLRQNDRNRILR